MFYILSSNLWTKFQRFVAWLEASFIPLPIIILLMLRLDHISGEMFYGTFLIKLSSTVLLVWIATAG